MNNKGNVQKIANFGRSNYKPPAQQRQKNNNALVAKNTTSQRGYSNKESSRPGPKKRQGGAGAQQAAAAAYATGQKSDEPIIQASRHQSRIVHRELVASVVGTANFTTANSFALNPGLPGSFPWLSTQAQAWEQYRFNKLKYCYYTRTGSNIPGSLMLIPDYDVTDAAPSSEQIASAYDDVAEDVPWKDISTELKPSSMFSMGPKKFVRTGAVPAGNDPKTYDAGTLFVGTTDGTAVNWGKLWVEYDITLFVPQLPPSGAGQLSSQHMTFTTPTTANNFATPVTIAGSSNIVSIAGNVLTFNQAGRFLVNYNAVATTVGTNSYGTFTGGLAAVTTYGMAGSGQYLSTSGQADGNASILVQTPLGGTMTSAITFVAGSTAELFIAQVPAGQT